MSSRLIAIVALAAALVAGCGGARLVKNAAPLSFDRPLSEAADTRLAATLDWVVVRNSPGAWARNADWDEYLLRVRNLSGAPLEITRIVVVDSLGVTVESGADRKSLVKASRQAVRRYGDSGLKVKAGLGGASLAASGIGVGLGAGAYATGGSASMGAGMAGAATFSLIVPAFAIAGVVRAVNNGKVNRELLRRQSSLPMPVPLAAEVSLDVFFPLTPSPRRVEVHYRDEDGEHVLAIGTEQSLAGLHLGR